MFPDAERHERLLAMYRSRVSAYEGVADDYSRRWSRWCRHLLQHGGELVVPHRGPEHRLDELLASAEVQPAPSRSVPGDDNGCHTNVAMLWTDGTVEAIGTGYALSDARITRAMPPQPARRHPLMPLIGESAASPGLLRGSSFLNAL